MTAHIRVTPAVANAYLRRRPEAVATLRAMARTILRGNKAQTDVDIVSRSCVDGETYALDGFHRPRATCEKPCPWCVEEPS